MIFHLLASVTFQIPLRVDGRVCNLLGRGQLRTVKPPRASARGFASRAYAPGKEEKHFIIAPLDPALPDGGSALRQRFASGE